LWRPSKIRLLAKELVEKLDHRTGVWRKWSEEREAVVKSAKGCWLPIDDLREYLNGMPGPSLTRMDVAQRLRAFQEDEYPPLLKAHPAWTQTTTERTRFRAYRSRLPS
jgi:hypothetical protein